MVLPLALKVPETVNVPVPLIFSVAPAFIVTSVIDTEVLTSG